MDFEAFLNRLCSSPAYRNQIVYHHCVEAREAEYADTRDPSSPACRAYLAAVGIARLFTHQAEAVDAIRDGKDVLLATGTASGKSLCYQLPLLEMLESGPQGTAILLYPTKALAQDQCQSLKRAIGPHPNPPLRGEGVPGNVPSPQPSPAKGEGEPHPNPLLAGEGAMVGVFDGDTPANVRRKLRDEGRIVLTNPDMLHAALLPQHARWAEFLQNLRYVVVDELHTYSGLFGSNAANLFRRFERVCKHYGANPTFIFCTATIGNPIEVAKKLTGREPVLIESDGSPRGKKTFVFWNPPRVRKRLWKPRRSANVEAEELMTELIKAAVPTITFSKAKVTAELIYRYVTDSLHRTAPHLAKKVTPYRGGYLAEERREIERRLFAGELLGVSTTRALELGIDIGGLDASIVVGYPGTLAGFFQQAGRAGRRDRESIVFLVAVDTAVNQYVMNHPDYIFGRPIERVVLDPDNPYVLAGQLRCAAYELPIAESEVDGFGPHARLVLDVLVEQHKLNKVGDKWYHASDDVPQHDVGLRWCDRFNVAIIDVDTNLVIGELSKYDAQPIIHPDAIYMHHGETYLVLDLDLERNQCFVKKVETDYYTQPAGGEDVHHVDHPLRERKFGEAKASFGEVSVYCRTAEYEKIHFYSLDAISRHSLDLPNYQLQTMAFWITPSEALVREVIAEGLDVHRGLMGIGYATRMILPLFIQCETLDFSHSSCTAINAPWHTMFVYERYPLGLGFTEQAYEIMADVIPAVLDQIEKCDCADGCPCCVGKPLRGYTTWNIERGEANVPSKKSALKILRGIVGDGSELQARDEDSLGQEEERRLIMERGIRRRLERMGEPEVFHPIEPSPEVGFPEIEKEAATSNSDVARRAIKLMKHKKPGADDDLQHELAKPQPAPEAKALRKLESQRCAEILHCVQDDSRGVEDDGQGVEDGSATPEIKLGDSVAAQARRLKKRGK